MKAAPLEYLAHAAGPASAPTERLEWALIALVVTVMLVVAVLLIVALARRRPPGQGERIGAEAGAWHGFTLAPAFRRSRFLLCWFMS